MRCSSVLAAVLAVSACAKGAAPGPRPERVEPSYGDPGGATAVLIRGTFPVKAAQSLAGASGNEVDATYQAWLGGTALVQVRWLDEGTLSASVPAGLAPGLHALEVEDPSGRRGALSGAFFAGVPTVSLSVAVTLSRTTASVGQAVGVTVAVTNAGNYPALGVLPSVGRTGPGAISPVAAPAPRDVAAGSTESYDFAFTAAAAGDVTLDVGASAPAPTGGTSSAAPWSGTVRVETPAALLATLSASPPVASTGQTVTLTLTVSNPGGALAAGVTPAAPAIGGGGTAAPSSGPLPAGPVAIPGGGSQAFTWTYRAGAAGAVSFATSASGADGNSGAPLAAVPTGPATVTVQAPASLAATVVADRARANVGQAVGVTLTVSNGGGAQARISAVAPTVSPPGAAACGAPAPALPLVIGGGASQVFTWSCTPAAAGAIALSASVGGSDLNSGDPLAAAPAVPAAVTAQTPAALALALAATPSSTTPGQAITLTLTVDNTGEAGATGVAPGTPVATGAGAAVLQSGPAPASQDVPGGASRAFQWTYLAQAAGAVAFEASATGTDANSGASVGAGPATSAPVQVLRPAALTALLVAPPAAVSVGQAFVLDLDVANGGESAAQALVPDLDAAAGTGACAPAGPALPASATAAPGATVRFTRAFTATAPGTVALRGGVAGVDATDGRAVSASAAAALLVQSPAALSATLSIPPAFAPGDFTVTLTVSNGGEAAAVGVLPGALAVAAGSSVTAVASVPFGPAQDVPGGETRSFSATWTASGTGALLLEGSASGSDANSGAAAATGTVTSNAATVDVPSIVDLLSVDPFGDGTRFLLVNGWLGQVLVGPNDHADRLALVPAAGGVAASRGLALPKDTNTAGQTSRNTWAGAPPYPSLGWSGCIPGNNERCGPDNEAGRGLFTTATVGGEEWAVAGPVREFGDGRYLYLAPASDDASPLPFRYADLSRQMGTGADGLTALLPLGTRLYAGMGGSVPKLLAIHTMPPTSGLDASAANQVEDLELDLMPGVGRNGTPANAAVNPVVDALAVFGGLLHLANNGGMVRATVADPQPYGQRASDWASCTPAAAAWGAKASVFTLFTSGLEPRARAVPALVPWGGRLLAIRNTQDGPQLWSCDPAAAGSPAACDPGDWSLSAPNLTGDAQLSQLGDAGNTRATLLVATASWLYLGFDNAAGVQLYRTAAATPVNAADFRGQGGCPAGTAGCQGLGGSGLGDAAGNTRFQDAKALAPPGAAGLYFTTGNGIGPARLHRILD